VYQNAELDEYLEKLIEACDIELS